MVNKVRMTAVAQIFIQLGAGKHNHHIFMIWAIGIFGSLTPCVMVQVFVFLTLTI